MINLLVLKYFVAFLDSSVRTAMFALVTILSMYCRRTFNDYRELHNHIDHQVDVSRPDFSGGTTCCLILVKDHLS